MPRDIRVNRRALLVIGAVVVLAAAGREIDLRYRTMVEQASCMPADWATPVRSLDRDSAVAVTGLPEHELARRGIELRPLGELHVEGGCIVGADPLVYPERPPFRGIVPSGRYSVTAYRKEGRVGLLEVRFSQGRVERWELAVVAGQDPATLKDDEIFGYPVDSGTGSFMDVTGQVALRRRMMIDEEKRGDASQAIIDLFGTADRQMMFEPLAGRPANVAVVDSGWGDGVYATYWGLDAANRPVVLVTDFYLEDDSRTTDSQAQP